MKTLDKKASFLATLYLRLKFDCYISFRADVYYYSNIRIGKNVIISDYAVLNYRSGYNNYETNIEIGENTKIMPNAKLIPQQGFIKIGRDCSIQYGCLLYGIGGLTIGENSRIAAYTVITPMEHIYDDPYIPIWKQGETARGITIGNDVWVGNCVKILDGVNIGNGAVIGAGSVVTADIPPLSVAVGVPAKVIKRRAKNA